MSTFTYRITVPAIPTAVPLYDVRILDDLGPVAADVRFVSASVVSGGTWSLSTGSATDLVIEDTATGIDIPASGQAIIAITVELQNTATNQRGLAFNNSASYTYNRMNGNDLTQTNGGAGLSSNISVVEPEVTASKTVSFVTPAGKLPTDPATVGDVLEYVLTIPNTGNATAFDIDVVDLLPVNVSLYPEPRRPGSTAATFPVLSPIPRCSPVVPWPGASRTATKPSISPPVRRWC